MLGVTPINYCLDAEWRHSTLGEMGLSNSEAASSVLESLPLFKGLSASSRAALLRNSVVHGVAAGTVLFEQGEEPNFLHVVLSGSVHLFGRSAGSREVLIEIAEPSDLVIPAAVMTGAPCSR